VTTYPSVKFSGGRVCHEHHQSLAKETSPDNYKYPKRPKVDGKLTPFVPTLLLAWMLMHGVQSGIDVLHDAV